MSALSDMNVSYEDFKSECSIFFKTLPEIGDSGLPRVDLMCSAIGHQYIARSGDWSEAEEYQGVILLNLVNRASLQFEISTN